MSIKILFSIGVFLCLIMPKYDIIDISGFYQGIRYDDLFLLFGIIILLNKNKLPLYIFPNKSFYFVFYSYILLFGTLSLYSNSIYSILLPLRWIEYSLFYIILFYSNISITNNSW